MTKHLGDCHGRKQWHEYPSCVGGLVGFGLGALIVLTPYFSTDATLSIDATSTPVQLATTFIGLMVLFAAFVERLQVIQGEEEQAREWEEVLEAVVGAALMGLPFLLGTLTAVPALLAFWLGCDRFPARHRELRRD